MFRSAFLAIVAITAAIYGNVGSAAAPAYKCNNCTGAAEEAMALSQPGLGIRFIYDLPQHTIRKFKVYLDASTNFVTDGVPVEPQPKEGS